MGFSSGFLRADSLISRPAGYLLRVQLPWMRSLPFSSVIDLSFAVDDHVSRGDDISLEIDGALVPLSDLAVRSDEWWFIQTPITIHVASTITPKPGQRVAVSARATLRVPYIITGPNQTMVVDQTASAELIAA